MTRRQDEDWQAQVFLFQGLRRDSAGCGPRRIRNLREPECPSVPAEGNARVITDEEVAAVQIGLRKFAPSQNCIVGTKGEHIEVFQAEGGHYHKMLRFTLTDETTRQFSVDRWCFRGSIDDWFFLDCGELRKLVEKYCRHLGKESFFELM